MFSALSDFLSRYKRPLGTLNKHRMDALTDGVMAIAMTLLVLDIKVPDLPHHVAARVLLSTLVEHLPTFAAFLLSFFVLGMFWYRHHHLTYWYKRLDGVLVLLNFLFLSAASFFPFAASLIGRYLNSISYLVYLSTLEVLAGSMMLQWLWARHRNLLNDEISPEQIQANQRRLLIPNIILPLCIILLVRHILRTA